MTRIAGIDKRIVTKIGDQLPRFLKERDTDLIPLLQGYYRWCDVVGNVQNQIYTFNDQTASRSADDVFVEHLLEQFNECLPKDIKIDKRVFIEHALEFYRLKGTEEGIKLFFRMIYGIEPDVIYPKDFILRTSDAIWVKSTFLRVNFIGNPDEAQKLVGKQILGQTSNATAIVESATTQVVENNTVTDIEISSLSGMFSDDEIVNAVGTEETIQARVFLTITNAVVDLAAIAAEPTPTLLRIGDPVPVTPATAAYNPTFSAVVTDVDNADVNGYGTIAAVRIENHGIQHAETPPVANVTPAGSVQFYTGTSYSVAGYYKGERGQISSRSAVLQDGKVFQEYSYVIRSTKSFTSFKQPLLCMVHPAGFHVAAEYLIDSDINDIKGRNILFHLSRTGAKETSELNFRYPGAVIQRPRHQFDANPNNDTFTFPPGKSPSRFVEPKIIIETGPETVQELLDRLTANDPLWFENPNNLNRDFSRNIRDYLNIPIGSYLYNMLPQDAYIPIEVMQLHDTFTEIQKDLETFVHRFDYHSANNELFGDNIVASMPENLEVGLFFEQVLGETWWMPNPRYRVYSYLTLNNCAYLLTEQGDTFLLEDGSVLCLGSIPPDSILLNEDGGAFNTEDGGTLSINNP